ncbi:MAG: NAD(P)H-dependent oxidoreductase [Hyphomonas sp.]|nr:NAD(P)H-dependent oxidoreductase [Hyphomonas sp.]
MTRKLLLVQASAGGPNSASRKLASLFVDAWKATFADHDVRERDVAADPIPHVAQAYLANMRSAPGRGDGQERRATFALTKTLQSEVLDATHIVIATPMHIFSVPSSLKAWADHIFHNGVTFAGSSTGVTGLLSGKKVVLITSRGGDYRPPSPLADFDMLVPYFRRLFAFCGVSDFASFDAHNAIFNAEDHAAQLEKMPDEMASFAQNWV